VPFLTAWICLAAHHRWLAGKLVACGQAGGLQARISVDAGRRPASSDRQVVPDCRRRAHRPAGEAVNCSQRNGCEALGRPRGSRAGASSRRYRSCRWWRERLSSAHICALIHCTNHSSVNSCTALPRSAAGAMQDVPGEGLQPCSSVRGGRYMSVSKGLQGRSRLRQPVAGWIRGECQELRRGGLPGV
jgi:hypothetical protein